jgi:hypothetical protein
MNGRWILLFRRLYFSGRSPHSPSGDLYDMKKRNTQIGEVVLIHRRDSMTQDYEFMPGMELCEIFYTEAVKPILDEHFPGLEYSAAHMGSGSDVLGFDTPQSMDHDWGPRLRLFLKESDIGDYHEKIDDTLRNKLPYEIRGFPTNYVVVESGSQIMVPVSSGPVNHDVKISTINDFFTAYFGLYPSEDFSIIDWLTIPEQILRSIVSGRVFHDGLGGLEPIMDRLSYYPHELWLYLLSSQWRRISQEIAFMGRTGQMGDELGSRIVGARLIRDMMKLCFLMEKQYAPYIKWFGTAFSKLTCAADLTAHFIRAMDADDWKEREEHLVEAYEYIGKMHNRLGITESLDAKVTDFYSRPFKIIRADQFAEAIRDVISNEEVKQLPEFLGGIDQYVDSTDVLSYTNRYRRFWSLYQ